MFFSYVLFFFPIYTWHFVNTYLADCISCVYEQSSELNSDIFPKCRNFLRSIFSILIYITKAPATLHRLLYIFIIFFIGFGQIVCSFLSVFSFEQDFFYSSRVFCSTTSLIMALALSNTCFFAVYPESHFF